MKRIRYISIFVLALISQVLAISIDFYDEQQNNSAIVGIRIRINNDTNVPITNAKIRYYFHRSSSPYKVECYYLAGATMNVTNVNNELAFIELDIPSIPQGYYPDMAGFSIALHHENWEPWDKDADYSYSATSIFTENSKIVLFSNDEIVLGEAPATEQRQNSDKIAFSGLRFSESPWIEIKNIGLTGVNLSNYTLVGLDDSAYALGDDSLGVGEVLRICKNQIDCDGIANSLILTDANWTDKGEAFLRKDSSMVSYMAWGEAGVHAAEAQEMGLWKNSSAYFPSEIAIDDFDVSYIKNRFFRLMPNKDASDIGNWFSFSSNDNPAIIAPIPLPIKRTANKPVIRRIPGEPDILFSWTPVDGIDEYRFILRDQNQNVVVDQITAMTSLKIPLAQGNYSWTVLGRDEFSDSIYYVTDNGDSIIQIYENIGIEDANINTDIYKQLQIQRLAARRDTRMLNLGYMGESYKYSWDRPNLEATSYEPHENSRCWAVAIEVMNHYYGGNLTQDEIVYRAKFKENDPLLSPFYRDAGVMKIDSATGALVGSTSETLKWALHVNSLNYQEGAPSYATVKNAIDHGKLVFIGVHEHNMVIYGYVGDASNYAFYYAFIDNDGNVGNSLFYDKPILKYAIPDVVHGDVEMSDIRVHRDSDNDGITDFEEEERFHTNPLLVDSDNDGIEDKREIYNYTAWATNNSSLSTNPYWPSINSNEGKKLTNPLYRDFNKIYNEADRNKNNILAENDPDDNGDDIEDGLKGSNSVIRMDVPDDFTIFGREYVMINDGVKCYNTEIESDAYCNIASSDENIFSYDISYAPVTIGARAHVGRIDVRKQNTQKKGPGTTSKPVLRSSAVIHNNLNLYAVSDNTTELVKLSEGYNNLDSITTAYMQSLKISDYITMQQNASVEGCINLSYSYKWKRNYTYEYNCYMPQIPENRGKIVRGGETYHLSDGDAFSTLRVESGATLIIEPGEMFVDKLLQIEPNATVRFAEPGKRTILHTNGDIIWRPYNSEDASNIQYWTNVARGFMLAHHSSRRFYIEGLWAGSIFAPKAKVILGQVNKTIYGRVLARSVVVHQFAKVFRVDFDPVDDMQVVYSIFSQRPIAQID